MKVLALSLLSILMMASFVVAAQGPVNTDDSGSEQKPVVTQQSSPSANRGGGDRYKCYTQWAWDGQEWVKRDVIRYTFTKGPDGSYIVKMKTINGRSCSTYAPKLGLTHLKPRTPGTHIDTLKPLNEKWYLQLKNVKGGAQ